MSENIHAIIYGVTGTGKSTFAATFPGPGLVFLFDPVDKSGPYLRAGNPQPLAQHEFAQYRDVLNKRGQLRWRIERYNDTSLGRLNKKGLPEVGAYQNFRNRVDQLYDELHQGVWQSIVVDSVTYMELAARKLEQYKLNPNAVGQGKQQWWSGSAETLEEMLMCVFSNFPCNVVVIAHTGSDKKKIKGGGDSLLYSVSAPGRLAQNLPTGYGETYRAYVTEDENGRERYQLQTRGSDDYFAGSQVGAPNPCEPRYKCLFGGRSAEAPAASQPDSEQSDAIGPGERQAESPAVS